MLIRKPVDTDRVIELRDRAARGEVLSAADRATLDAAARPDREVVVTGKDDGELRLGR